MIGSVCHADQCAEPQTVGVGFDASERGALKGVDIDHDLGPHDVEFHQVDERRAAGKKWGVPGPCVRPAAAIIAAAGESARSNKKGRMSDSLHGALCLSNSLHDVGVSGAAEQVSAHEFANLRVIARVPFPNAADRRDDLPGGAVAALKRV